MTYLKRLMEQYNRSPSDHCSPVYYERPPKLIALYKKYNVTSVFDSGCKDRHWMKHVDYTGNGIKYIGGDISQHMVDISRNLFPDLEIIQHDATSDPFPDVDLLFSSDVMIHVNNEDKLKFLKNFCNSNIKYLLMTDSNQARPNLDIKYDDHMTFPFEEVNWYLEPWSFPTAIDFINDDKNDQRLRLWTKNQIKQAIDKI